MPTYRVGAVNDEPLQQDAGDLLLHHLRLGLGEQVEQHAAEVVRVLVGVPELVRHRVQEEVATLGVQLVGQLISGHFLVSWRGSGTAIETTKETTGTAVTEVQKKTRNEMNAVWLGANNA